MFSFFKRRSGGESTDGVQNDKCTKPKSRHVDPMTKYKPAEYVAVDDPPREGASKRRFKIWDEENARFCGMNLLSDKPYKPKPPRNKVKMKYRSNGEFGPGYYYVIPSGGYSDGGGYSSGGYCGGDGGGGGGGGGDGGGGGACGGI